jgi:hypothetical protein
MRNCGSVARCKNEISKREKASEANHTATEQGANSEE